MIENLFKLLKDLTEIDTSEKKEEVKVFDIKNPVDRLDLQKQLKELESSKKELNKFGNLFGLTDILNNVIDTTIKAGNNLIDKYEEEEKKEVVTTTTTEAPKEKLVKPSEVLEDINIKLNIHRLTKEYVDKYIDPYIKNTQDAQSISNDIYSGLFEFACWIYNKK